MNVADLISCPGCYSNLKFKLLHCENKSVDGLLNCSQCGYKGAVINSIVILHENQTTRALLDQFNRKYRQQISFFSKDSAYDSLVAKQQTTKKTRLGQVFNAVFYLTTLFTISLLRFPFRKAPPEEMENIIEQLAEAYHYVPEMAVQKFIEIAAIKSCMPVEHLGALIDVGGGNGIVTKALTSGLKYHYIINIDLYPNQTDVFDLQLAADVSAISLKPEIADTLVLFVFWNIFQMPM